VTAAIPGWTHTYSGKVRDLYVPEGPTTSLGDVVLVVASDRVSAYDHVLSPGIPGKGVVLTQLSLWWFEQLADLVPNHVVSTDVPSEVAGRAMICRRLEMFPVECVARGYLTGSGLAEYRVSGSVTGIPLPDGLVDGSRLPEPIFTPATKAELGSHGRHRDVLVVFPPRRFGRRREDGLRQLGALGEAGRERDPADGPAPLVVVPARPGQVAAGDAFHPDHREPLAGHGPAREPGRDGGVHQVVEGALPADPEPDPAARHQNR